MNDRSPRLGQLQQYVIEWAVEDPERYQRLSRALVGRQGDVPNTVITCVLEVPRRATEQVTAALRESLNLRHATYLSRCAEHADGAAEMTDAQVKMRMTIEALEQLALSYAERLDALEKRPGKEYVANFYATMQQIRTTIPKKNDDAVRDIRRALGEKRAEVAAQMLAKMGDDD